MHLILSTSYCHKSALQRLNHRAYLSDVDKNQYFVSGAKIKLAMVAICIVTLLAIIIIHSQPVVKYSQSPFTTKDTSRCVLIREHLLALKRICI